MIKTTYQKPEIRDANDNIIQQGAFGKNTALANATNDGWIDYVANDLEALYDITMGGTGGEINTETITGKTGTITNLTATTVKAGTLTADALNGPLTGDVTGNVTGNLTGNVTGTADKAVADGKGNNIVNTYVTKSDLSSSVSTTSLTVSGETSVPTANAGNSSKAIANTEYVQGELTNYLPLSGGTVTGVVNGVTPPNGDNSKKLATTEFVNNAKAGNYLPLSGGTLTGVVNGVTPTAGDNSTKIATTEFVNAKAGLPVGFEAFTTNPTLQAGWLPLLGGEYSRTTYADLWAWVQTQEGYLIGESVWQAKAAANSGNVPFYSSGDGSTTFRVPALKCWVRGANSISEVGGYLEAQYPLTEHYHAFGFNTSDNSGDFIAVQATGTYKLPDGGGTRNWNGSGGGGSFKAATSLTSEANMITSLSVGVQGNSDTVQPQTIVGLWIVKAYGTVTNVGSTDVANISTGLTQAETRISAAETRISALENHGAGATVVESYRNGTEWYRVWSDGWVEQGGQLHWAATRNPEDKTVTLYKVMVDTNYNTLIETIKVKGGVTFGTSCYNHTTTAFTAFAYGHADNDKSVGLIWFACGQGA